MTTAAVTRHRFTVEAYARMREAGLLHEDDRVELLDGEIYQMSPIGARHVSLVNRLTALLVHLAGDAAIVSVQNPICRQCCSRHTIPRSCNVMRRASGST